MLIQVSNGNTDFFKIIARNIRYLVHIDCVIISIARVIFLMPVIPAVQNQLFMAFGVIKIGKPSDALYSNIFPAISIYAASCRPKRIIIWNMKLSVSTMNTCAKPQTIILNERKYLFVCNCVHIGDNQEFLIVFYQLRYILPEQRERRICHHNVRLFEILDTFL